MLNNFTIKNSKSLTPNKTKKTGLEMGLCSSLFYSKGVDKLKVGNHIESVANKKLIFQFLGTVWEI